MFDAYYDEFEELEDLMKEDEQKKYSQSQDLSVLKMLEINTPSDLNKIKKIVKILLEVVK